MPESNFYHRIACGERVHVFVFDFRGSLVFAKQRHASHTVGFPLPTSPVHTSGQSCARESWHLVLIRPKVDKQRVRTGAGAVCELATRTRFSLRFLGFPTA